MTASYGHTVNISPSIMPQTPRVGGVIMIKANDRTAVEAIIAQDPFNINGIADYQIVEFTPTMFCDNILKNIF